MDEIKIREGEEYIKLGQALKKAGLVGSGVDAKIVIQDGLVKVNGEIDTRRGKKLYDGINREVAHSVICTMSSIKSNVDFPKEYEEEIEAKETLPNIRDMVSGDMSALFPDMKKMFFVGNKEEFHKRMKMVFDNDVETFSDLVDASVKHKSEAGVYQYIDMVNDAINKSIGMDFSTKTHIL